MDTAIFIACDSWEALWRRTWGLPVGYSAFMEEWGYWRIGFDYEVADMGFTLSYCCSGLERVDET